MSTVPKRGSFTNMDELYEFLRANGLGSLGEDNAGQLVIYTGCEAIAPPNDSGITEIIEMPDNHYNAEGHYNTDGSWTSFSPLFRDLTKNEVEHFKQYAKDNPPPHDIEITHPVCREVWATQNGN